MKTCVKLCSKHLALHSTHFVSYINSCFWIQDRHYWTRTLFDITKQYVQHQLFFLSTYNSAIIFHNIMCYICVKPSTSEGENYFSSLLKDPPSDSTHSTSAFHHHHLGYNSCHYLTAEHKMTQKARKYLHAGMQLHFFQVQGVTIPHILSGGPDKQIQIYICSWKQNN